eukprot:GEMP01023654.1.p1 GENE.GEMP01023654.1~~GEMP01023654.1.p1  ORF type:complete len:459 (-),score=73.18 GEMP01023654.1:985-2361(-)
MSCLRRIALASFLVEARVWGSAAETSSSSFVLDYPTPISMPMQHDEDLASITAIPTPTTTASNRRRLDYWKSSKCHQQGRWTFSLGIAVDKGFLKKCDPAATDEGCKTRVKEMIKNASEVFYENFGINIGMASWISPTHFGDNALINESPDAIGNCPLIPNSQDEPEHRVKKFEAFRRDELHGETQAAWLLFTDCGERVGLITLGISYQGRVCSQNSQVLVVRYRKIGKQSSEGTWRTLAHELGHLFGAQEHRERSIMSYSKNLEWDGELQFHPQDELIICEVIQHSLGIIEHSSSYPKRTSIPITNCAVPTVPTVPTSSDSTSGTSDTAPTSTTTSTSTTSTSTTSTPDSSAPGENAPDAASKEDDGIGTGLIALLVVLGIALCLCAVTGAVCCLLKRGKNKDSSRARDTALQTSLPVDTANNAPRLPTYTKAGSQKSQKARKKKSTGKEMKQQSVE